MSPRLSVLEEKMEVQDAMDLLEMGEEAKTTEFVIGTEPGAESEKGSVEGEVFETPQQGKKKIVAAKSAAAGGVASSVEWPPLQETAEKLNLKTGEELRQRLEFEKNEKELQELKTLRKRLDDNEAEMNKFREESAKDKEKLREKFEREKYQMAEDTKRMVQELTRREIKKQREEKEREGHKTRWQEKGQWQPEEESGSDESEQRRKKSEPQRRSERKREESNQNLVFSEMLKLIKEERSLRSPKREKDEEEEGGE